MAGKESELGRRHDVPRSDEALEALRGRTGRIRAIEPLDPAFRLRYRSVNLGPVHVSRTWETHARFRIVGAPVPVVFFPLAGRAVMTTRRADHACTAASGGSFTVAEATDTVSGKGYSELVVRLDPDALLGMLAQLDVHAPLDKLLGAAAMRRELPGLDRLQILACDAFLDVEANAGRFADLNRKVQAQAILLHAANVLAHVAAPVDERTVAPHAPLALKRAEDFIRDRLCDDVDVASMAEAAGVSIRQLQVLFRQAHGRSPMDHLRGCRLDMAHDLLSKRKAMSVTQAALECGFSHLGKFAAHYQQRFGEPPSHTLRRSS